MFYCSTGLSITSDVFVHIKWVIFLSWCFFLLLFPLFLKLKKKSVPRDIRQSLRLKHQVCMKCEKKPNTGVVCVHAKGDKYPCTKKIEETALYLCFALCHRK